MSRSMWIRTRSCNSGATGFVSSQAIQVSLFAGGARSPGWMLSGSGLVFGSEKM
jgi:hypothetical protein